MGVRSLINSTYTPPNHKSATENPSTVVQHINKELSYGRYTGPFSRSRLENLIGPFRSSPLGTVPKSEPNQFRIIQDLSFPRNDPSHASVNAEIDSAMFPCDWGTFTQVAEIVRNSAPGTQAATMDVDAAFRCCPITPPQQPHFIIHWDDAFYIDHNAPFGATSSGGIFGRLADAMSAIIRSYTAAECTKWVDDFVFFRSPVSSSTQSENIHYSYDLDLIQKLALRLGWPWKPEKTQVFAPTFKYLGFVWDIDAKTVHIPENKRLKYYQKLEGWLSRTTHSRKEAESVLGTLVHCSLALPDGRSRLPALSRFITSFEGKSTFSRRTPNSKTTQDVRWWKTTLSQPLPGSSIRAPPPPSSLDIWVDASTSFGIGVVFEQEWDAWKLLPGWDTDPLHRIGWAEAVALEFGIRLALHKGFHGLHLVIKSDNMGVIGALEGGKSRNSEQNLVLQRISTLLHTHSTWVSTLYTPSALNLADKPSRGIPPDGKCRTIDTFDLPSCLSPLILPRTELPNILVS